MGQVREQYGWASFSGKNTYLDHTMTEAEGNHEFMVYIEDRNEPGSGLDKLWFRGLDMDGLVIDDISMPAPAEINNVPINGGNLVVPH